MTSVAAVSLTPRATGSRRRRRDPRPPLAKPPRRAGAVGRPDSPPPPLHPALHLVNDSTKWIVSASCIAALLLAEPGPAGGRDAVAWTLAGAVASAGTTRALKRALDHRRPAGAAKADPGMPSSHAQSLAFLGRGRGRGEGGGGGGGGGESVGEGGGGFRHLSRRPGPDPPPPSLSPTSPPGPRPQRLSSPNLPPSPPPSSP